MRVVLSLFLMLVLSACSTNDDRTIYVENAKHTQVKPLPKDMAYRVWQSQKPDPNFYSHKPSVADTYIARKESPECTLVSKGLASWYGHELAGNHTANGEMFMPDGITAAHPNLPFGTILKVTLDSGKGNPDGVYVRVNDRGPFVHGRIIDLSLGAAKKLGMKDTQAVHVYQCT